MGFVLDCVSDTHDSHHALHFPRFQPPPGDRWLLLHGGDFSHRGGSEETARFVAWLADQPHERKVVICGNHELAFDPAYVGPADARRPAMVVRGEVIFRGVADYLEESSVDCFGLHIFGSPYSLRFYDWAFQTDRGADAAARWARIPVGTDVVLVHGPPYGHGDACPDYRDRTASVHVGDPQLLQRLREVRPAACVFGHIHESAGLSTDETSGVTMVNAAVLDRAYVSRGTFVRLRLDDDRRVVSATVERLAVSR